MSSFAAFIMGLIQGLTEFFPVSSSAHLKLAKIFFGLQTSENQVIFDLVCHFGTLFAVLFFLRRDIFNLFKYERKKLCMLFIATLPLIPCYFLLKPLRDWASQTHLLGFFLILTSAILFAGQHLRFKRMSPPSLRKEVYDVLWIGAMQSTALIPGISRSASTISCAQALGWSPTEAVRFSFLLSIPTIFGGNVLELLKRSASMEPAASISFSSCLIGFLSSCIIGFIVIRYAVRMLERGNLRPFAWYCLIMGIAAAVYLNFFNAL
ncbi:MAG TPA: undecaprenyl-diphosphate phosphatase [Rhabdochlamydiaceae bacterium]|nr:undecaprenyl-diphosphate phosphatase [Rhabdochlamydiaceae bacterium]